MTAIAAALSVGTFAAAAMGAGNATSGVSSGTAQAAPTRAHWQMVPRALTARKLSYGVDRQAPKTPAGLGVTAVSATSITLTWSASRDNVGVTGYGVYLNNVRIASVAVRSYRLSALSCGKTYRLGVDAFDAARNRSGIASILAATGPCVDATAPSAPTNVHQSSWSQTGIGVEWGHASDNVGVAGYRVYRDGVPIATTQQSAAWVANLVCSAGYSVSVEAYDAAGNHSPRAAAVVNTTACADTNPPSLPRNLSLSGSTVSSISVAWDSATDDRGVVEYRLSLDDLNLRTVTGTTTSFTGLACGRSYVVKVTAADAAGNVSPSASMIAPTAPCPSAPIADTQAPTTPSALVRFDGSLTSIALSWSASTDNVGVASYGIYRSGTKVADATVTGYELQNLACGTSYSLSVDAVDVVGNRSPKATVVAATEPCADTQAPLAPTGLGSLNRTETSITVTWQASADTAGYRVYRDGTLVGSTASTSYNAAGLVCGKTYTFSVEAYDTAGNYSARAATLASTTACSDSVAPSSPTSLTKAASTATSVSLSWVAASDNVAVAGYSLYVGGALIGTTPQSSYTFAGLTCGTTYVLGLEAYDAAGNRSARVSFSAATVACVTTPPPPPAPAGSLYVATNGSDANPCTQAQPCLSFGRAYKAAAPGTTVLVAAGTYPGQEISYDPTKTSTAPVVFQPASGAVTVNGTFDFGQEQFDRLGPRNVTLRNMNVKYLRSWRGSDNLAWENIDGAHFDVLDSTNVAIRGGDFGPCQAPRDDPACVSRIAGTSSNVLVDGASIHDVTSTDLATYHVDGMFIRGGSNIVIRNSKFWGNMITNIRVQEQPCCANTNLLFENNWFNAPLQGDGVTPRANSIDVDTPVRGSLTIQFNSFSENSGPQIVAPAVVKGNLMQNATCAPGVTYAYNLFIPFSPYTGQNPCGPTDKKVASFGYLSNSLGGTFNYRLSGVTLGVDTVPVSSLCPALDFEGTQRPQGGACDAGADER